MQAEDPPGGGDEVPLKRDRAGHAGHAGHESCKSCQTAPCPPPPALFFQSPVIHLFLFLMIHKIWCCFKNMN